MDVFPFLLHCNVWLTAPKSLPYPKELRWVGDQLKKCRRDPGLFQTHVAVRLGVTEWPIDNWETNTSQPAIRFIPRILVFLRYELYPAPQSLAERLVAMRRCLGLSRRRMAQLVKLIT